MRKRPWDRKAIWSNGSKSRTLRARLMVRDRSRCRYCDVEVFENLVDEDGHQAPNAATVEHWPLPRAVLPVERWWDDDCTILACYGCNQAQQEKGGLRPIDCPLPIEDRWPSALAQALARAMEARHGGS